MGNEFLAVAAKSSGFNPTDLIFLVLIIGVFYLLILRPQRRRQQRTVQMQTAITPGQQIRTTAGIYGTIVSADDQDVVVQVAPGVEMRMLRRAVMDVVPGDVPTAAEDGHPVPEPQPDDARSEERDPGNRKV